MIALLKFQFQALSRSIAAIICLIAIPFVGMLMNAIFDSTAIPQNSMIGMLLWFSLLQVIIVGSLIFEINGSDVMKRIYVTKITKMEVINTFVIFYLIVATLGFAYILLLTFSMSSLWGPEGMELFKKADIGSVFFGYILGAFAAALFAFWTTTLVKRHLSQIGLLGVWAILAFMFSGFYQSMSPVPVGVTYAKNEGGVFFGIIMGIGYITPMGNVETFMWNASKGDQVWNIVSGYLTQSAYRVGSSGFGPTTQIPGGFAAVSIFVPVAYSILLYILNLKFFKRIMA